MTQTMSMAQVLTRQGLQEWLCCGLWQFGAQLQDNKRQQETTIMDLKTVVKDPSKKLVVEAVRLLSESPVFAQVFAEQAERIRKHTEVYAGLLQRE
jgi:hypothetical protein